MSEENTTIPDSELQRRREWFKLYVARTEQASKPDSDSSPPYACPCCGYPTLSERGGYDICSLCNWEDDGQDDPHQNERWGGPNGRYSLAEARENFKRFWIMYDPEDDKRIGGPDSALEIQAKREAARAFDIMRVTTDECEQKNLMAVVATNMEILRSESRRKVREYEARMTKDAPRP